MTSAALRSPLQPTSKAPSTAKSSQLLAVADHTPATSRASSRVRDPKPARPEIPKNDFTSVQTTSSLIRRVLVPEPHHALEAHASPRPVEELLPPLTSSNDVDIELYAILAIVIKDFVNTWYSKITPDHAFIDEVIQIIAHVSRALEQRLRAIDTVELCMNEIPVLFERHILAYRAAKASRLERPYGGQPRQIYHTLNPHPALNPNVSSEQQSRTEAVYRQLLMQGALAALLPTEDLQNVCLRTLVTDVVSDLILGRTLSERMCEAWFLHDALSKIVTVITARMKPRVIVQETQPDKRSRLDKFGLLSVKRSTLANELPKRHQSLLSIWLWTVLQHIYIAYLVVRYVAIGIAQANTLPSRTHRFSPPKSLAKVLNSVTKPTRATASANIATFDPSHLVLDYRILPTISTLLDLSTRMPWFVGVLSFGQHALTSNLVGLAGPNSRLDEFLYHNLEQHVLSPSLIPLLLVNLRTTIFPGNTLGPPAPPVPSVEETLRIRRRAAEDLLSLIPEFMARTVFATANREETIEEIETEVLDVFSDANMNKHLIYGILELVMVRLLPELAEKTPSELLSERGVNIDYGEKEIL